MSQIIKANIYRMSIGFLNDNELTLRDVFGGEKSSAPVVFCLINFNGAKILENIKIPLLVEAVHFLLLVNLKKVIRALLL